MSGYWVVEFYNGEELIGCWTTEQPGKTGPADLEEILADMVWHGRIVRWVDAA